MKILVIGNGIAGNEVAFSLRRARRDWDITILSAEHFPEYDPCSLPYFIGGDVPRETVFRRRWDDYGKSGIRLLLGQPAASVDPEARRVTTANGMTLEYDRLVLAHGGSLFIPPIAGIDKEGIHSCKQLDAADRLDRCRGSAAVVIGSGAIGIEAAEALKKRGYEVTIIELLDWILPALFDPETSGRLEERLNRCGIRVRTGEKVLRIEGGDRVSAVVTDRRRIACDTVVIATGVVPGKALAQTAAIETGRGIRVNEHMQTSAADIYACGDCVETVDACTGEDAMFQLKHNALEQAQVAARHILGETVAYPGAWAFARAHFFDTHAVTFGKTTRATQCELGQLEIIERDEDEDYLRVIVKEGLVVGGQAIGKFADFIGLFVGAMWRKDAIPGIRANWPLISRRGSPYPWTVRKIGELIGLKP
jgi:NADH oxidase (H2O2-forming)